jgi:tetratricopeptide (TPR) repeat protein
VRTGRLAVIAVALVVVSACRREGGGALDADPLAGARSLVEQGRYDEAIARIGSAPGADAQYLLGRAWAGKAQGAPVPAPAPGATPGGSPLKPEEALALECFERALAERPDHAGAHLAIADLLAPHAVAAKAAGKAGAGAAGAPDTGVDRVLRSYGSAAQADPTGTTALEAFIRVATATGGLDEADLAFRELVRRRPEDPGLLVRYGDFLATRKRDAEAAVERYGQALIWRPDDTSTRTKVAEIHLAAASALLSQRQYALAESRLREARRLALDPASAPARHLVELEARLREIRGR